MHRMRGKPTSFGRGLDAWKGVSWEVILTVNSRQAVERVDAIAHRVIGPDLQWHWSEGRDIGPFDSLHDTIRDLLVDSAIGTLDEMLEVVQPPIPGLGG